MEHLIREVQETTGALRTLEQVAQSISQWRRLTTGLARNAPAARRDVLMRAAGWGQGSPRSVKAMKDVLLTIKSRMAVHADEFRALGLSPVLLQLPEQVLALLERGAGEVAREKAEDMVARANVTELYWKVNVPLAAAWRAAELIRMQAQLIEGHDGASAGDRARQKGVARRAGELLMKLETSLGEARVQAGKRAAAGPLPPGIDAPAPEPDAEPAGKSVA